MTPEEKADYQRGYDTAMTDKAWTEPDNVEYMEGWFRAIEDRIKVYKYRTWSAAYYQPSENPIP